MPKIEKPFVSPSDLNSVQFELDSLESNLNIVENNISNLQTVSGLLYNPTQSILSIATKTHSRLHFYANGDIGNDNNDGLSEISPKKTLNGISSILPDLANEDIIIHLSGTFSEQNGKFFISFGSSGGVAGVPRMWIDGGSDITVIAGPFIADISTGSSIGLSSLSLVADQYSGYWLEILDGAEAGNKYIINEHDSTTFFPGKNFTSIPSGAQFRVVRPATTITSSSTFSALNIECTNDDSLIYLQRLYFSGSKQRLSLRGNTALYATIFESTDSLGCFSNFDYSIAMGSTGIFDVQDIPSFDVSYKTGFSQRSGSKVTLNSIALTSAILSYLTNITFDDCGTYLAFLGTHVNGSILFRNSNALSSALGGIKNTSGYYPTTIRGSSSVGLILESNSNIDIEDNVVIRNNISHGIEVNRSFLRMKSVSGNSNGGAGVYAHSQSLVHIENGNPPTLTGTIGNTSIDGTSASSTWTTIDGGSPVVDLNELTIIKEI